MPHSSRELEYSFFFFASFILKITWPRTFWTSRIELIHALFSSPLSLFSGRGPGHPDPEIRRGGGGGLKKNFFSALRASVCFKNKAPRFFPRFFHLLWWLDWYFRYIILCNLHLDCLSSFLHVNFLSLTIKSYSTIRDCWWPFQSALYPIQAIFMKAIRSWTICSAVHW